MVNAMNNNANVAGGGVQSAHAESRLPGVMRGLWQLTLFVVVISFGLAVLVFGLVAQFNPNAAEAFRVTLVLCGGGFLVTALVVGIIVGMILSTRHYSMATVAGVTEQQRETNQLIREQIIRSDATMQALISLTRQQMQAGPAAIAPPAVSNTTQQLPPAVIINGPQRKATWMYPILRDGKTAYVRGDLIEHYVRWGLDEALSADESNFRDYMRKRGVSLANDQQGMIRAALAHEGVLLDNNEWATDDQGVWAAVTRMRARGVQA